MSFLFPLLAFTFATAATLMAESKPGLRTVAQVDLNRYAGKWYEIARYPNRFQKDCVGDTSATYTLLPDGSVRVVNECRSAEGTVKRAVGRGKVSDNRSNAKLKVSFFWPFYGKYWILDLGADYEYAVVGEPSRKYLWILSRTPQMEPAVYESLLRKLEATGYDPSRLLRTSQSGQPTGR